LDFCKKNQVDYTIVGPEAPLAAGIVDRFRQAGAAIIGPDQNAARLETSKAHAKAFMERYGVNSGKFRIFSEYEAALHYAKKYFRQDSPDLEPRTGALREQPARPFPPASPLVIKADGLAGGKGVIIAHSLGEAESALHSFMREGVLGAAGKTILIEEFLAGREVSILAAVSVSPGKPGQILPFIPARDHKSRFSGGTGPNTGGMGAIAPVPDFSGAPQQDFITRILTPTLRGMEQEKLEYRGFLFFGLMVKDTQCFLLEYNVRLGDPETQAVLPLLDADLSDLCRAVLLGKLDSFPLAWKAGAVCAPVAVAEGYPGAYRKGDPITVAAEAFSHTKARLFIAGASLPSGTAQYPQAVSAGRVPPHSLVTSGGRVLTVAARGSTHEEARAKAYQALAGVSFTGIACREDIGAS
jgi:phosphoribosylamine--glycine ligase